MGFIFHRSTKIWEKTRSFRYGSPEDFMSKGPYRVNRMVEVADECILYL